MINSPFGYSTAIVDNSRPHYTVVVDMSIPAPFLPPSGPVDVLLFEDSLADAEITMMALREMGLSRGVGLFRAALPALDFLFCTGAFQHRIPDQPRLILLDGHLPDLEGLEVLRKVRAHIYTSRIPVVMISSAMSQQELDQAYSHGANACMAKPASMDPYCQVIKRTAAYWLDRQLVLATVG